MDLSAALLQVIGLYPNDAHTLEPYLENPQEVRTNLLNR